MDGRIAIIGNEELYAGFKALGVEVMDPSKEGKQAGEILALLDPARYAIVFVSEPEAHYVWDIISERNRNTSQTVTVIPAGHEQTGAAGMKIRELVRRAVGADVG
jgi:vacuolar-type H+-ATPase subunit F/Vma7